MAGTDDSDGTLLFYRPEFSDTPARTSSNSHLTQINRPSSELCDAVKSTMEI